MRHFSKYALFASHLSRSGGFLGYSNFIADGSIATYRCIASDRSIGDDFMNLYWFKIRDKRKKRLCLDQAQV